MAVIEQVPAAKIVTVFPETVHTPGVVDVRLTVRPDDAVATTANGAIPKVTLPNDPKKIVCDA